MKHDLSLIALTKIRFVQPERASGQFDLRLIKDMNKVYVPTVMSPVE